MNERRPPRLGVRVLGPFALEGVDLGALRSRKARRVLAVLALAEGAPVGIDALVEAVWDGDPPVDPARDLAVLVSRGRALVGADRLLRRPAGYLLHADWWDRVECHALVRSAARRRDAGDLAGARTAAEAALALVRGPLLADEPDAAWAEPTRAATSAVIADARRLVAETALSAGQIGAAAAEAREALDHDPYDEAAARLLMRAQASGGRPATALATYARLAERLADDLGVDPSAETRHLHEQILRAETVGPPPVPSRVEETAFVGREPELRRLDAALAESRRAARVVVVIGEPGVGKSALLAHWAAGARARGVCVVAGRAEDQALALQPVIDALAGQSTLDEGRRSASTLVEGQRSASTYDTPTPSEDDRVAIRRLPGPVASVEALHRRMFAEVDAAFEALTAAGPTALLIDDLQAADPQTRGWLGHVLRRAVSHPFLVVAATSDLRIGLPPDVERLPLPPLDLEALTALVGPDRAPELYARTGGNPLLATELARSSDELPATIRAAVAERLTGTGDAAVTLQTAAVLGQRIDLDLLAGVLDSAPLMLLDHLDAGVRTGFLVEREGTLQFRHELVRAAVAAETGTTRRTWIHRQATRLLAARPGAPPLELIRHARLGGDSTALVAGLVAAAELARSRLDLPGAEALLGEAVTVEDGSDLRLRRARIRLARGDLDGADSDAQAAMATDATGQALELRTWVARNRHDLETAIRLGTAGAASAADLATRVSCSVAVALSHRGLGDLRAADQELAEAAALGPPAELGLPAWIGILRVHQGRPVEALARLEPLLGAEADRALQAYWVEHTLQMTAHAYGLIGRSADALAVLDRLALELDRRGTGVRYAGTTDTYRSWILRNLGEVGAIDLARSGLQHGGSMEIRAQCHLDLADCLLRSGALDEAAAHVDQADRAARAKWFNNQWRFDQRLGILRARLALATGEPEHAAEQAALVRAAADERGDRRYRAVATVVLATALARAGQSYDADDVRVELGLLPEVAALEAWWLAGDLAEASGSAEIRAQAISAVDRLVAEAGEHAEALRAEARRRLG